MFDIGLPEMVALAVLALLIFGDRLPEVAADVGRMLRQLRRMAAGARRDLTEGLGPEFDELSMSDLNPRTAEGQPAAAGGAREAALRRGRDLITPRS